MGTFTTTTYRKEILINQVMLIKVRYLAYVEKPSADIIQNITYVLYMTSFGTREKLE